ncbi:glycosyltransferase family 1 protein [Parafrigoribacterium mesophilum]|uniref:glycosyltransferase family 4 protein n=1 Tax=Parafrigoribacterium mesophilum TaxID=433646 RepID=UPI0031FBED14
MPTLRVILDQMIAPVPGGIGRYTEELTQGLIDTAPAGCTVAGMLSASTDADLRNVSARLPGLDGIDRATLPRKALQAMWQFGLTDLHGQGMVHATSLFGPLTRHDHDGGDQIVVTIHDAVPWTHPETLTRHGASWHRTMASRAQKFADAIVVPTQTVAQQLSEILDFGDRVRVIGGAVSTKLVVPADADIRAAALGLPAEFILSVGTLEPRKGIAALIRSLAVPESVDLPLLIVGPPGWGTLDVGAIAAEAGVASDRVRTLGFLSDADLAIALDRASVFVFPSLAEGFGLPIIEAFHFGTPVVHSDDPALLEVSGGAGLGVALENPEEYPRRLASAIASVVSDSTMAQRMRASGLERARSFSWAASAEKVWRLHADL